MRTLDQRGLEMGWPDDLALAFNRLPALPARDDGLDGLGGVGGRAGSGDGVGYVVHGGDTDVVRHAISGGRHCSAVSCDVWPAKDTEQCVLFLRREPGGDERMRVRN